MTTSEILDLIKDYGWTILSATEQKIRLLKDDVYATIYTGGYGSTVMTSTGRNIREYKQVQSDTLCKILGIPQKVEKIVEKVEPAKPQNSAKKVPTKKRGRKPKTKKS